MRRCIAFDEAKLMVKKLYVWPAIDVDSRELLVLEASTPRLERSPLP